MVKALIFDCFGVVYRDSGIDRELLDYIKDLKLNYKTAMLSNIGRGFLNGIFDDKHPRHNYFDELVSSDEIGVSKPNPEAYNIVCERLGIDPQEVIFIDDNAGHCRGAEAVGMSAIVFHDFEQFKNDLQEILN